MFKNFIKRILLRIVAFVHANDPTMQQLQQAVMDADIRAHDAQDRVYDVLYRLDEQAAVIGQVQEVLRDAGIRVHDSQDVLEEVRTRVHDTQEWTYDILFHLRNDETASLRDIGIRTHDVQDRIYDTLWQIKTQNHQREMMFWQIYKRPDEDLEAAQLRFFGMLPPASGIERKSQLIELSLLRIIHEACEKNGLQYWLDFGTLLGAYRHKGFIPWDDDLDIGMMRGDAEKLASVLKEDPRVKVRNFFVNNHDGNGMHRPFQVRYADTPTGPLRIYIDIFIYDYCEKIGFEDWNKVEKQKDALVKKSHELPKVNPGKEDVSDEMEIQQQLLDVYEDHAQRVNEYLQIRPSVSAGVVWGFDNFRLLNYKTAHIYPYETYFPLTKMVFEGEVFWAPAAYRSYLDSMYGDIFSLPSDMLAHRHINITAAKLEKLNWLYDHFVAGDDDKRKTAFDNLKPTDFKE